ncbi:Na+/H+ antiporter subunit E [Pontivivens nitratireducens]|uniref:Na+/H+ antiporter subunit E n=1 Tax=Pontivivens nitratireducens TaxID=2758038 RepID=A0A6G7VJ87_9RHOB|nr:Na+/H+ antiporter subunit E [Pontibrevibacter nitratireducens]QIK40163.1 Na+/H+ antiporter subunit E [Pontibrevibacter nitratireducens]
MKHLLRPFWVLNLLLYFVWDLLWSSLEVAWDVLTPQDRARPRVLLLPLDARSDAEIMATANLISLTPGSLSIDVSDDRATLMIHTMFGAEDPEGTKNSLKRGIERRVLRVLR